MCLHPLRIHLTSLMPEGLYLFFVSCLISEPLSPTEGVPVAPQGPPRTQRSRLHSLPIAVNSEFELTRSV